MVRTKSLEGGTGKNIKSSYYKLQYGISFMGQPPYTDTSFQLSGYIKQDHETTNLETFK